MSKKDEPAPGDGIRSMRTSRVFRAVNFELYAKPVSLHIFLGYVFECLEALF